MDNLAQETHYDIPNINDISSVSLQYPEEFKTNVPPLKVSKVAIPEDLVGYYKLPDEQFVRPEGLPPRLTVDLPESRNLHLDLKFNGGMGFGRTSFAYAVSTYGDGPSLPPMVAKVARKGFNSFVARENWFYDELACLQGSVIPRCFGFFSVKLSESELLDWDLIRPNTKSTLANPEEMKQQTQMDINPDGHELGKFRPEVLGDACDPDHLCFILLECLSGVTLPSEQRGWKKHAHREEVFALFRSLADRGVCHGDLKYYKVVRVLKSWPSLPCPVGRETGRVFQWRIIDFEMSQKHDKNIFWSDHCHKVVLDYEFWRPYKERFNIVDDPVHRNTDD